LKIQVKALKVSRMASEETLCFTAKIYLDGKFLAKASNRGQGGPTNIYCEMAQHQAFQDWIEKHAAILLDVDRKRWDEFYDKHDHLTRPVSTPLDTAQNGRDALESIVDNLVDELDEERQNKSWHQKGVVYRSNGEIGMMGYNKSIVGREDEKALRDSAEQKIKEKFPDAEIVKPNPNAGILAISTTQH